MSNDQQAELKLRFAKALLSEPQLDPYRAALTIEGIDTGTAMQIASLWVNDPDVMQEMKRLIDNPKESSSILPTKEKQAIDIYKLASNEKIAPEDRLKFHRLYAEIMGHIQKEKNEINLNPVQNIIVVPTLGDDDNWEERAIEQQRKLIHGDTGAVN